MALSQQRQEKTQQNLFLENELTPHYAVANEVMELFAPSNSLVATEAKMAVETDVLIDNFLNAVNTNSSIEFSSLIETFADSQVPTNPADFDSYLEYLASNVINHSIHTSSPRFIGHMTSALPCFVRPLAKLMTAMNQNVVKIETAKAFSPYERQALAMIHRLIYNFSDEFYSEHVQNSQSTLGILVSGGTAANIIALWCARNKSLGAKNSFPGVEKAGLTAALDYYGYQGAVIIGSELMHFSFEKAADLLGIGTHSLIKIPTNRNNQVDLVALRQAVADCQSKNLHIIAIAGVAGTTDSGNIDSLSDIADIAEAANVHFHVDAAWGGPLIFSEQHRQKLAGIERADSVTIDGHKQLYLPMGIGMVFMREPHLASAIEKNASYTMRKGSFDLGKRALEGSRPGMALFLHAGLHLIGLKGYEFLIDAGIEKTQYMADCINAMPEFELLSEPDINLLLYRYIPQSLREVAVKKQLAESENKQINIFNERLQKSQRQAGRTFISRTTKRINCLDREISLTALRAVIANPLTTKDDIDAVLHDQIKIALDLEISDC
ncbi:MULTISPECIES: pyridoxal-dependent aspartate 1-decarboxylase PanP [Nostoc]|uniref:Pyridoxal-dependent aspartate 1-decarboxylase n=1 Tax=Nostoc paludosum FACHB-159 TaxID=2692908 RepID=A0ABR8K5P3_9NOSO|nr:MULTISPECIES: putative pyridoxal-dependent aspartate 1-decarboxylase [Nostoc]MBD2677478.1 putative pyridoxal-dependent aspartate 1-decarboxylase [Nostoc sp. FACHB-857]MBD2734129.1 putative pyridoxal-dependent aspartate 1-decarboxylase [Nostoc paludosum FACHB-159]